MANNKKTEKDRLRSEIYSLLDRTSKKQKSDWSEEIFRHLQLLRAFQGAKRILLFHSMSNEPNTGLLIDHLHGKRPLYLPRTKDRTLEVCPYEGPSFMVEHPKLPLLQPSTLPLNDLSQIDLAIIPGVAFDGALNRLGHGMGYYDWLLPKLSCPRIGYAFALQIVNKVPTEPHDEVLDGVLTEKGLMV